MTETTAAGLLAPVGIFDVVGTIVSGALTDVVNPRLLLVGCYTFRGVGLLVLLWLLGPTVRPPILVFTVIYGLGWVATVPTTVALCREAFGASGTIVSAGCSPPTRSGRPSPPSAPGRSGRDRAVRPGLVRAAGLCVVAAVISLIIRRRPHPVTEG